MVTHSIQASSIKTPSITAIVQARMSSSRLPGKVLETIGGYPVVVGILKRLANTGLFQHVVLATSEEHSDDILVNTVEQAGFSVVRGSLNNVLERFCSASDAYPSDYCVRITADCPFVDAQCLQELIAYFIQQKADYASNALAPTLPDGFDCEIFTRKALLMARQCAEKDIEKEHVTYHIYQHPETFTIASLTYPNDYSHWRVTLDTPEDLLLIQQLEAIISKPYLNIALPDVLQALQENPSLVTLNSMHCRNDQLDSSL